ncbi:MAG: SDR family NAD(P)-dependent oxidoreductase [Actinomycetes bacterium]
MTGRLDGSVALVTGASSGIGEATARALAAEGAVVAVAARRKDRLEELTARIEQDGGRALALTTDVTEQAQAVDAVERTVSEYGRLDILVNNAGVMYLGPVVDAPTDEWDRMVQINVMGLLYTAHAALPHLARAAEDSGRRVADLVNISSVAARKANPVGAVYSLTKYGVNGFSEGLRQEVRGKHVRVSVVEPGQVETELNDHIRPEIRERMNRRPPQYDRLGSDDVADAVTYVVTRPRHVAVGELLVRPTEQER